MVDTVENLVSDLKEMGWVKVNTSGNLMLTRGETMITGHQEYVEVQHGDFSTRSSITSRFLTTKDRLAFLLAEIRRFADMACSGKLDEMARWHVAQRSIEKASWKQVLQCPKALALVEQAVALIHSEDVDGGE